MSQHILRAQIGPKVRELLIKSLARFGQKFNRRVVEIWVVIDRAYVPEVKDRWIHCASTLNQASTFNTTTIQHRLIS